MTKEQKKAAIQSLMFLTEKQDGSIKSRVCADGSVERRQPGFKKEYGVLPTVATESVS